jgi:glycosyltransferase involved in cell wall biosynthesis
MSAVTVLMPVHDGERYVAEAVDSVLGQHWRDFEFVIVDDGSTDRTAEILASVRDPRIRVLTNDARLGIARSLNRGLDAATSPLIARQDADDRSHPSRLAEQLAFFDAHPGLALLGTQVRLLDARGRLSRPPGWQRPTGCAAIRFQLLFDNAFLHSTVMFRRDAGRYDESVATAEDYDLWSRIAAGHAVANLPRTLVDLRFHAASTAAHFGSEHLVHDAAVVARNLRDALGDDVPDDWPRTIALLHVDRSARAALDGRDVVALFTALFERYLERHPEAGGDREIRRVMAAKMAQLGRFFARTHRRAALAAFARACRLAFS